MYRTHGFKKQEDFTNFIILGLLLFLHFSRYTDAGEILNNRALDGTTRKLITEAQTDTRAKVRFRRALSENFEIKTVLR